MFADIDGVRFNTVSFGAGPRTLVGHGGWAGSWELWQQPFELMSPSWRCVSYDHRGSGESRAEPETITAQRLVDDLFALLDHLEVDRCILAGESMGGFIAMLAVERDPSRFDGLVLVDSATGFTDPSPLAVGARRDYPETVRQFMIRCVPEPDSQHVRQWGEDILLRATPEAAARLFEGCYGVTVDPTSIAIPTLVLHGELDTAVPLATSERLASQIRGAELRVIRGAGHVPTMTRPREVVAAITDWAATLPAPATT